MKTKLAGYLVLFSLAVGSLWAQAVAGLGGMSGTVRDTSGAAVPGATVVVTNDSKGITRSVDTTGSGVFNAPALVPASGYSITVSKQGFTTWEAKDVEILVGQTVDFNITLQVASAVTQVEVTGEAPLVEDTKTGVSQVIEKTQIDNLPINGRRADSFALLSPAVVPDGTFGLLSFRGIAAGNSFLTDGNDTTESFYNENAGRTRIDTNLSQDAVQEFQVLSDGYSAEFGRAMGGVLNTVTRSGTNETHGTAYWFFRNRTLDAADRYAAGLNPPEWRHDAGASLGGPIKKDTLFYFANFEIVDRNFPALNRIINTAFTDTSGNLIPSDCKAPATPAQCTAAINFIQKQMNVLVPRTVNSDMGFAKLDWRPNERNSFSFDMNVMHWKSPDGIQTQAVLTGGNALGNNGNSTVEDRYGKASWTYVPTSSSVNELRFGWFKDRLSDPAASQLWPSTGPLYITVASSTIGAAQAYPRTYPSENRFQIVDNYSWTKGSHSVKFGVDFSTTEDWMNQLFNRYGSYSYSTLTAFAQDFSGNAIGAKDYTSMGQAFGNPIHEIRTTDINFYAQDVWRMNSRFTLNYGLRYEKTFLPQPTITNPNYPQTSHINSPNKDFSPRLSASYLLNSKTVIRAGFGLFYARFDGDGLDTLFLGNGLYQTSVSVQPTFAGAPVFPNIFASATGLPQSSVTLEFAAPNFRNPYTEQGNFSIERELARNLGLTVNYIWTHGVAMWTQRDLNLGPPGPTETYIIDDASGNQVGTYSTPIYIAQNRMDSRYSKILQVENGGQTWYNALAVQLNKRMSHSLQANIAYTWSHAIEDGNEQGASYNLAWSFNNATVNGNYPLDKGSSTLDQRHRAVIMFLWDPTFTSSTSKFARYFVNGWELSQITTLASSMPTAATINVSGTQFTGVTPAFTTTLNGSGGWTRVPFWPVNNLDIDRIYHVDARLSRDLPISERIKAKLMFEAFDVFNTIYNTAVNTQAFTATGGVLRPTPGLGVGNASQGFPDGTNARRMQVALRVTF
ncbi:MAG TPA: carboxypeptidase regulatory-like domain-containing protein [Bryobacteraceae bacterium]|nr:carboxypeptidase regulatory-like domain-containing protein [Bryobacteraceae bacterium]